MVQINGHTTKTAISPKKSEESRWSQNQGSETRKNYLYACKNEAPFPDLIIRYQNTTLRDNEDRNKWRHLLWWKERLGSLKLTEIISPLIVKYRDELSNRKN